METSAKTAANVTDLFVAIGEDISEMSACNLVKFGKISSPLNLTARKMPKSDQQSSHSQLRGRGIDLTAASSNASGCCK